MKSQFFGASTCLAAHPVRRILLPIGLSVGLGASLAACGGPTDSQVASGPSPVESAAEVNLEGTRSEAIPEQQPNFGPLDQFIFRISNLQWLPSDAVFDMGGVAAAIGAREMAEIETRNSFEEQEFIASCMHDLGFEYTPSPRTVTVVESDPGTFIPRNSREWAERFGFGHTTTNAVDRANSEFQIISNFDMGVWDARDQHLAQMSESERHAWENALHRWPESADDWPTTPDEARQKLGCSGQFWFFREQQLLQPEFSGIRTLVLEEFPRLLENDPQVQELNTSWSRCMVENGYPGWVSPALTSRAFALMYKQPSDGAPFDADTFLSWDWETYPEGPPEIERSELRAQEVATAVASWDCRDRVNYDAEWQRLNFEIQQAFVDQHWLDLEDWARAVEVERR